jgi:hypothetical protein
VSIKTVKQPGITGDDQEKDASRAQVTLERAHSLNLEEGVLFSDILRADLSRFLVFLVRILQPTQMSRIEISSQIFIVQIFTR